jgi:hypothetical protein
MGMAFFRQLRGIWKSLTLRERVPLNLARLPTFRQQCQSSGSDYGEFRKPRIRSW